MCVLYVFQSVSVGGGLFVCMVFPFCVCLSVFVFVVVGRGVRLYLVVCFLFFVCVSLCVTCAFVCSSRYVSLNNLMYLYICIFVCVDVRVLIYMIRFACESVRSSCV